MRDRQDSGTNKSRFCQLKVLICTELTQDSKREAHTLLFDRVSQHGYHRDEKLSMLMSSNDEITISMAALVPLPANSDQASSSGAFFSLDHGRILNTHLSTSIGIPYKFDRVTRHHRQEKKRNHGAIRFVEVREDGAEKRGGKERCDGHLRARTVWVRKEHHHVARTVKLVPANLRGRGDHFSEVTKLSDILKPVGAGGKNLELYSYGSFTQAWEKKRASKGNMFDKPTIVFWDLEVLPTYFGEIAMGGLAHSAFLASSHLPQRAAIFILAGHLCKRTLEVFQRRLGEPTYIKFDQERPEVQWRIQEDEEGSAGWWPGDALEADAEKCVVRAGTPGPYSNRIDQMLDSLEIQGRSNELVHYLTVAHDVPWSTHLKGLTMLYSPKHMGDLLLDRKNGQLLAKERVLTRSELDRLHSWASKSEAASGQAVEIVAPYSREDMENFPDKPDSFGSAWNRDMLFTVLRVHQFWDLWHIADIPIRSPVGGSDWLRAKDVLTLSGCLVRRDDKFWITHRGKIVCNLRSRGSCRNWNAAMLLAIAVETRSQKPDSIIPRLLLTISALLEWDSVSSFFSIDPKWAWPVEKARIDICDGPASWHSYAGSLWFSMGLFCRMYDTSFGDHVALEENSIIHSSEVKRAQEDCFAYLFCAGVPKAGLPSWRQLGPLDREEAREVNIALAQAFLFQILWFGPRPSDLQIGRDEHRVLEVIDCHSGRPRASSIGRGWCANEDEVTYVSTAALYSMAEAQNQRWPDMVCRSDWGMK
ncbi:hypothetical protein SCUP234_05955 [Seiridium cupressi]